MPCRVMTVDRVIGPKGWFKKGRADTAAAMNTKTAV